MTVETTAEHAASLLARCAGSCATLRVLAASIRSQWSDCPVQCEIALGLETLANELEPAEQETF